MAKGVMAISVLALRIRRCNEDQKGEVSEMCRKLHYAMLHPVLISNRLDSLPFVKQFYATRGSSGIPCRESLKASNKHNLLLSDSRRRLMEIVLSHQPTPVSGCKLFTTGTLYEFVSSPDEALCETCVRVLGSVICFYGPLMMACGGSLHHEQGAVFVVVAALLAEEARRRDEAQTLERRSKRKRRMWTREWLQRRSEFSHMQLVRQLQDKNPHDFRNFLRMSEETFIYLSELISPLIQRRDTRMRSAIPVDERLAVTLRFLATGRSFQDLHFSAAISRPLLSVLIPETCRAIFECLRSFMEFPKTSEDWKQIASDFEELWQFLNYCGALDGKHVRITQPPNSGSYFYNYKGYFSIILMALVNAKYEFIYVDVGMNGRVSDGGVLEHTHFGESLFGSDLQLPSNSDTRGNMNFVFVGDEALPLNPHLLKPFPLKTITPERRIFNYRLSRARRVVENAFGIMANRFRVLHTPMNMKLDSIDSVVMACCVLHNFLRRRDSSSYCPPGFMDSVDATNGEVQLGEWRSNAPAIADLRLLGPGRYTQDAKACREEYCHYFNGPGAVPWQHQQ
ncbi:uncharacterized protein [Dendrobates tinctorius]|uniref:uncharacterized protein n=1 Tax=Dendrobates tinctorius TaxID=92724 RepID=UPI003CC9FC9D